MKRIGRYEVIRELRAGGMGSVTLGKSPDGQLVVLKRPHTVDAAAAVRLRDEARIGARLLHPAIVDTLDLFEADGVPVLVVAYVDGPSLEVLRPLGPLPTGVIARVGRQIAEGLSALHETCDEHGKPLHILHRDVTPGNIVVGRDGDAKLIDLGIARFSERQAEHTQDGFLRGTMRYLAPELLQGDTYSAASDLWALGMVLWEAALGRFAYRGETDREVLAGILRCEPMELEDDEHVDEELVEVIRPLLHPSPVLRLSNGAELAARFAALEARFGDTAALTQITIADALERKAVKDRERKARLATLLPAGGLAFPRPTPAEDPAAAFADVKTAAETEAYEPAPPAPSPAPPAGPAATSSPFGAMPSTEPLALAEVRPPDPFVDEATVVAHEDALAADAFEGEATVNVPAPVSFLVGAPQPASPPSAPPAIAEPDEDESKSEGEDPLDATFPMPTLALPREALRSDEADLSERARGFDSDGEGFAAPAVALAADLAAFVDPAETHAEELAPTTVAAVPPELLARSLQSTSQPPTAPLPLAPPAPAPPAAAPAAISTAIPPQPPAAPPAPVPQSPTPSGPQLVARIALARKTPEQIERERTAAKAAPRPPSIDDLPRARPKPREERAEDELTVLSPFDPFSAVSAPEEPDEREEQTLVSPPFAPPPEGVSEPSAEPPSAPGAAVAASPLPAEPFLNPWAPPSDEGPRPAHSPPPVVEHALPASLFATGTDDASGPLRVVIGSPLPASAIAASPEPARPAPPPTPPPRPARESPFASLFSAHPPLVEPAPERPAPARPSRKERAAGEVMKLSDVVAFLDDD